MKILGILHDFRIFFIGKGYFYFTGPWGRLEKFLPFFFRIITSYLKIVECPAGHSKIIITILTSNI